MELKFVIPNMEKTFGNLEFAGEDKTEQRRINGRMAVLSRSFNLYSDKMCIRDSFLTETGVEELQKGYKIILQPFYDLWRSTGEDFEVFLQYTDLSLIHI